MCIFIFFLKKTLHCVATRNTKINRFLYYIHVNVLPVWIYSVRPETTEANFPNGDNLVTDNQKTFSFHFTFVLRERNSASVDFFWLRHIQVRRDINGKRKAVCSMNQQILFSFKKTHSFCKKSFNSVASR